MTHAHECFLCRDHLDHPDHCCVCDCGATQALKWSKWQKRKKGALLTQAEVDRNMESDGFHRDYRND